VLGDVMLKLELNIVYDCYLGRSNYEGLGSSVVE
jgi:hypothetical protein